MAERKMPKNDPRRQGNLLRKLPEVPEEAALPERKPPRRPPGNARCEQCGSADLSRLPSFSVGSGIAARPVSDDVYCHRCGHIAPPLLEG